ncbi:tetratricopeptide repeat protein [Psychromonas sp.]|nr:tetratricopeptide repeat protein [Psychromonas sp.]
MVDIIEGYETEEQQVDAIKKWWKENGTTLIVAAVIGLSGLWGWRYYGDSVHTTQEQASTAFDKALVEFKADSTEKGATELKTFIADNESSNYATLATLLLVKEATDANNFELAKTQLIDLLENNSYEPLLPVIQLRLARVQAELGEFEQALTLVDNITAKGFVARANQVKGSIYLKQGNIESAHSALQAAVDASEGRVDPLLELQLDDLAVVTTGAAPAPKLDAAK